MESLFIILVITALVVYAFSLYNNQLFNRKCFLKTKKELEYYSHAESDKSNNFIYPNRNLEEILQNYNNKLDNNPGSLSIIKSYKFAKNNICDSIKPQITNIINKVLNHINNCDNMKFKFLEIETVNKYISGCGKILYRVVFLLYEVNKFTTRKLIVDYIVNGAQFSVLQVNTLQSLAKLPEIKGIEDNNQIEYEKIDKYDNSSLFQTNGNRNKWILDTEMTRLNRMGLMKPQEPCKYDLHQWDETSVGAQIKLDDSCTGINHSDILLAKQPYINPTIFQLPLPDEGVIPHTLAMKQN